jgi:hypothetical protein
VKAKSASVKARKQAVYETAGGMIRAGLMDA